MPTSEIPAGEQRRDWPASRGSANNAVLAAALVLTRRCCDLPMSCCPSQGSRPAERRLREFWSSRHRAELHGNGRLSTTARDRADAGSPLARDQLDMPISRRNRDVQTAAHAAKTAVRLSVDVHLNPDCRVAEPRPHERKHCLSSRRLNAASRTRRRRVRNLRLALATCHKSHISPSSINGETSDIAIWRVAASRASGVAAAGGRPALADRDRTLRTPSPADTMWTQPAQIEPGAADQNRTTRTSIAARTPLIFRGRTAEPA